MRVRQIIFILALTLLFPQTVLAAKPFVKKTKKVTTKTKTISSAIPSVVSYRSDKNGILLSFSNFNNLDSVSYSFTYTTNGNPQGAGGVIRETNIPTVQRELLFGTCSTSVCTYHNNLSNAKLTLTAKYKNGKTATKRYRIKTYR